MTSDIAPPPFSHLDAVFCELLIETVYKGPKRRTGFLCFGIEHNDTIMTIEYDTFYILWFFCLARKK